MYRSLCDHLDIGKVFIFYWDCKLSVESPQRTASWGSIVHSHGIERMIWLGLDREKIFCLKEPLDTWEECNNMLVNFFLGGWCEKVTLWNVDGVATLLIGNHSHTTCPATSWSHKATTCEQRMLHSSGSRFPSLSLPTTFGMKSFIKVKSSQKTLNLTIRF